ncbi:hypothetical protein PCAR4_1040010 [Paraburkholderia caribensis]|nr:hypothetical protein PCAR4_1040010 [Paraburkholderia caribensis]
MPGCQKGVISLVMQMMSGANVGSYVKTSQASSFALHRKTRWHTQSNHGRRRLSAFRHRSDAKAGCRPKSSRGSSRVCNSSSTGIREVKRRGRMRRSSHIALS